MAANPKTNTTAAAAAAPAISSLMASSKNNNATAPSISPIKKTASSTNKSSSSSPSTTTSKQSTTKKDSAIDNVKFTSTSSKKSPSKKSSSNTTTSSTASAAAAAAAATEKQLKLQKAEIAKRELKELEAMERAFRDDMEVWNGPNNVVFPRRYHSLEQLKTNGTTSNNIAGDAANNSLANTNKKKKKGDNTNAKEKEKDAKGIYYGSQSQGWMYGDGLARLGGLSWMDVTSPPSSAHSSSKRKKSDAANTTATAPGQQPPPPPPPITTLKSSSGFLVDDVSIIDKSLLSAGLTRSHLTPRAYACLLEQARRYTLELLADAQDYAVHANRDSIASLLPADLLLAAEMRGDTAGVTSTLPRVEELMFLAEEVNRVPLPSIPRDCYGGLVLPPVEEQLTARTFDVVNGARVVQRMMRGGDYPLVLGEVGSLGKKGGGGGGGGGGRKVGSYGAGIGRQIAVNLKSGKGDEKSKGGAGASAATSKSKASSGSKGQKRKLTEL